MSNEDQELAWGETPLDKLPPEELLLAAKRMYGALEEMVTEASGNCSGAT